MEAARFPVYILGKNNPKTLTAMKETLTTDKNGKLISITRTVESWKDPNLRVLLISRIRPDGQESIVFGKVFKP